MQPQSGQPVISSKARPATLAVPYATALTAIRPSQSIPSLAQQHPEYLPRSSAGVQVRQAQRPGDEGMAAMLSDDDMRNVPACWPRAGQPGFAGRQGPGLPGERIYRGGISHIAPCAPAATAPTAPAFQRSTCACLGQHGDHTVPADRLPRRQARQQQPDEPGGRQASTTARSRPWPITLPVCVDPHQFWGDSWYSGNLAPIIAPAGRRAHLNGMARLFAIRPLRFFNASTVFGTRPRAGSQAITFLLHHRVVVVDAVSRLRC